MTLQTSEFDAGIRKHLADALRGGHAFESFDEIIKQVPADKRFVAAGPEGRSAWQIVEHMRRTLNDLADYSQNEDGTYKDLNWPEDYWPAAPAPGAGEDWTTSVAECRKATDRVEKLLLDPERDLLTPFPWGEGQTLMREVLLAIEHTAYHLGELVELTVCLQAHN